MVTLLRSVLLSEKQPKCQAGPTYLMLSTGSTGNTCFEVSIAMVVSILSQVIK